MESFITDIETKYFDGINNDNLNSIIYVRKCLQVIAIRPF